MQMEAEDNVFLFQDNEPVRTVLTVLCDNIPADRSPLSQPPKQAHGQPIL